MTKKKRINAKAKIKTRRPRRAKELSAVGGLPAAAQDSDPISGGSVERKSAGQNVLEPFETVKDVSVAAVELSRLSMQLQMCSHCSDFELSREAFIALSHLLRELLKWLQVHAYLPEFALGLLSHELPKDEAWRTYLRGDHIAGWAGVELARLYKQFKTELASRSKESANPFQRALFGMTIGNLTLPGNRWFRDEYNRNTDYRPTGRMAIWVARRIQDVWRLKENRSRWRRMLALSLAIQASAGSVNEVEEKLKIWSNSNVVEGERSLQRVDQLPSFGSGGEEEIRTWRSFIRSVLLTNKKIVDDFDSAFPNQRRKLDGVIASTLASVWDAAKHGGRVILPED